MKTIKLAILSASVAVSLAGAAAADAPASGLVGAWSDAKGIEVELWKHGGELFGFLSERVGPDADPPVGKLESIRFDEKTGAISFVSKLSVGVVPAPGGNTWLPSKNLYEFKGAAGKSAMTGILRRKYVQEDGSDIAYEENLVLKNRRAADGDPEPGESFEEWKKRWTEAVKQRGPKW